MTLSGFPPHNVSRKILFIPLDDRPPNFQHVTRLAKMAELPIFFAKKLIGRNGYGALIISLDGYVYGGLVASRRMEIGKTNAVARLNHIRAFSRSHRDSPVYAFGTILRSYPSKGTWMRGDVRERNHAVLLQSVRMVYEGVIHTLLIGVEDADRSGPAPRERREIKKMISSLGLEKRVFLVDGADELGQMLLARYILEQQGKAVHFIPHYSAPEFQRRVARYESVSIQKNIYAHSAVFSVLPHAPRRKWRVPIFIHVHPGPMRDLHLETFRAGCPSALKDVRWVRRQRNRVAIADIAYANGACPDFAYAFCKGLSRADKMFFSGWNTAGNTIGSVMAWAAIAQASKVHRKLHAQFFTERILDDFLYQTLLRRTLAGPHEENLLRSQLLRDYATLFPRKKNSPLRDLRVRFPWHRLFEVELEAILE